MPQHALGMSNVLLVFTSNGIRVTHELRDVISARLEKQKQIRGKMWENMKEKGLCAKDNRKKLNSHIPTTTL